MRSVQGALGEVRFPVLWSDVCVQFALGKSQFEQRRCMHWVLTEFHVSVHSASLRLLAEEIDSIPFSEPSCSEERVGTVGQ